MHFGMNILDRLYNKLLHRFLESRRINKDKSTTLKFGNNPNNLVIDHPRRIINPHRMFLGDNINIGPGSLLMAVEKYEGITIVPSEVEKPQQHFEPKLIIGNRVTATGMLQISVLHEIIIEDDVMFATNIFICDASHGYRNADLPYKFQPMEGIKPIRIGKGSWIGQNVVIMPGVEIGSNCIIGANSVVTKSIPARTIAYGSPAQVTKIWNSDKKCWTSVLEKCVE
jgi:acetyltransferase-like isoleucine patch superfamily enzyme